jgi:hypothetical protein
MEPAGITIVESAAAVKVACWVITEAPVVSAEIVPSLLVV